jgi:Tfp pilus assembly protein PilO
MKQPSKILNLGKREKIQQANSTMLIMVAVAAVVVSFSLVTANFLWKQKQYNDAIYKQEKLADTTLQNNLTSANSLTQQFQEINSGGSVANAQTILDALPSSYDNPGLLASIENLVQQNSLTLTSLTSTDLEGQVPSSSANPSPVQMPFAVTVEGTYANVNNLVSTLQHSIRPMSVQSLVMTGTDNDLTATFQVITYYQPAKTLNTTTQEVK